MREDFGVDWDKMSQAEREKIRQYVRNELVNINHNPTTTVTDADINAGIRAHLQGQRERGLLGQAHALAESPEERRERLREASGPNYPDGTEDDHEEPAEPHLDLALFQEEVHAWCLANFGKQSDLVLYGGTAEEAGEMMRGAVKREQGIRGTRDEWNAEIRKEMGDIVVKLASVAAAEGWSLIEIINTRWADVRKRVWSGADKTGHGMPEENA